MITIVKRRDRHQNSFDHDRAGDAPYFVKLGFRAILLACAFVIVILVIYIYITSNGNKTRSGQITFSGINDIDAFLAELDKTRQEFELHHDGVDDHATPSEPEIKSEKPYPKNKWDYQAQRTPQKKPKREKIFLKKFAYYVLAPGCLPDELLFKNALGDGSHLDVFVNSYTNLCFTNTKPHITYILNTTTTWTSGRNMLYSYVKSKKREYTYHIFLDDDVGLFYTDYVLAYANQLGKPVEDHYVLSMFQSDPSGLKEAQREIRDGKSAWRTFEDDLLERSPAFATTNLLKLYGFESRSTQLRHWERICVNSSTMPWITTAFFLDALFVAYHDEAMPLIFPYTEIYEKNWWTSAIIQTFRARELFYKQGMCNFKVAVLNHMHRKYPREKIPNNIIRQYIQREAPELEDVLDHRLLDYGPFQKWQHNEDFFYGDPAICTGPLKFPITKHYVVTKQRKRS